MTTNSANRAATSGPAARRAEAVTTSGRQPGPPGGPGADPAGATLLELLLVLAVVIIVSAVAVPSVRASLDSTRGKAAARYLAMKLYAVRAEAVKRSTHVGVRIDASASFRLATYADGNGDGVRTRDIGTGVDPMLGPGERLDVLFPGVTFGILAGVTAVDSHDLLQAGGDPIRLGSSDILSFGPLGTATAGTVYLSGRGREQYAVRVLGATGRIRVMRFDFASHEWGSP
jgi:type II secretory pathway pseudopilin PulG